MGFCHFAELLIPGKHGMLANYVACCLFLFQLPTETGSSSLVPPRKQRAPPKDPLSRTSRGVQAVKPENGFTQTA